jgi:hypothetical protein
MELERRARETRECAERNRLKSATAKHVMALWNVALAAGWRTVFYPSIGTALATGCHWLHVVCPACQQLGETDLRKLDIHPNASIGVVIRAMSCWRCSPHPPFARPLPKPESLGGSAQRVIRVIRFSIREARPTDLRGLLRFLPFAPVVEVKKTSHPMIQESSDGSFDDSGVIRWRINHPMTRG